MASDTASLTSSRSPIGGSDIRDESLKVFEVSISNCEDVLGKKKTVDVAVRTAWKILNTQHGQCLCGEIFKVNMLDRGKGFRVFMLNCSMEDVTTTIIPFYQTHFERLTGATVTTKLSSDEDVKALRRRDVEFKVQMETLKTDMLDRGMAVADNLSTMLRKRKNQGSLTTQRKVGKLCDFSDTINYVARARLKVRNDEEGSDTEEERS